MLRRATGGRAISLGLALFCSGSFLLQARTHTTDPQTHAAKGLVLKASPSHHTIVISCEAIPRYMGPMEMSFEVHDQRALAKLKPGMMVRFRIVPSGRRLFADDILPTAAENFESEPMDAAGLSAVQSALNPAANEAVVKPGESVPDFTLTDQTGAQVHFSQFKSKVILLTFGYSRCPNPDYCFRLSNNLAVVEKRFHQQAGRELVLLTIAIDPEHDQGAVLANYAHVWKADPNAWHFLTGSVAQVKQVAGLFGMNFWRDEGLLTHPLHTVVVDREGRLAANLEGNRFTPRQLGDLVQSIL